MRRLLSILLLGAIVACQEGNDPGRNAAVQISFATEAEPAPLLHTGSGAFLNDTIGIGPDTLVITQVMLVLREIELKRVSTPDCSGGDECEKFETGPVLVTLPLGPGAQQRFALDAVPAASYREVEFEIHKPDDGDPADQAFIAANPDFAHISLRVRGTFNGAAFEFTTELDVEQELELNPALEVTAGTSTNVTIFVNVSSWFVVSGVLVDPGDPGVADEIEENIENSFRAFEDPDRSGSDDD